MITKRIGLAAVAFACLFTATAGAQYLFVKHRLFSVAAASLADWANEIDREIGFHNGWNLEGFRHADISAPNFAAFTADGFLIEIEGFVPSILPFAEPVASDTGRGPRSVRTEVGETIRTLEKQVDGGAVVLAVSDIDNQLQDLASIDDLLIRTAEKFGSTLDSAIKVAARNIDGRVEYAVLADTGEVKLANGWPPLKFNLDNKPPAPEGVRWAVATGKRLLVYNKPIIDERGQPVGKIVLPRDVSAEEHALHQTGIFNLWLAIASWIIAVVLLAVPVLRYEFEKRSLEISLEEALQKGEGQNIEFKTGVIDANVAKVIAAFANTNPGNIFVGVEDNGGVSGLREATLKDRDQLLRKVRQIATMIQPPVAPEATFLPHDGKTVPRLLVRKGIHPLYVLQGTVWVRRLAEVVAADRQEIIERAVGAGRTLTRGDRGASRRW